MAAGEKDVDGGGGVSFTCVSRDVSGVNNKGRCAKRVGYISAYSMGARV